MRWTAPHSMRRRHTVVTAVFLWGACVWLRSSGGSSLALGPALDPRFKANAKCPCGGDRPCQHGAAGDNVCFAFADAGKEICPAGSHLCISEESVMVGLGGSGRGALRGASESASAPSPSTTFVYAGADLDVHMLKYLAEDETRAVFLDPLGLQSKSSNELGAPTVFGKIHARDPRASFRRDSREFRPFRIDQIRAFRDMLRDRFKDEQFADVHLRVDGPRTVAGSFVLDKIRREFTYIIHGMDTGLATTVLRGHHVTTYVTLGYKAPESAVPGAWKRTIRRRIMGRKQAPRGAAIYPLHDYPARDTQAGAGSRPVMVFIKH